VRFQKNGSANGHPKVESMADIAILREQIGGRRHFRFIQCAISLVCPQLATLESFKNFETLIRKRRT